jgi:hypothetical protein
MATVQLIHSRYQSVRIKSRLLDLERILAVICVRGRGPAVVREAVIDTGAPISVFPENQWRAFQTSVRWLTKLNDPTIPGWCREFSGAAGGVISCRLGILTVEIYGAKLKEKIGPIEIAAMFAHDDGAMKADILFGLGGGTLTGRRLKVNYDETKAVLVEI